MGTGRSRIVLVHKGLIHLLVAFDDIGGSERRDFNAQVFGDMTLVDLIAIGVLQYLEERVHLWREVNFLAANQCNTARMNQSKRRF